jgi:hypothetical protein
MKIKTKRKSIRNFTIEKTALNRFKILRDIWNGEEAVRVLKLSPNGFQENEPVRTFVQFTYHCSQTARF